MVRGRRITRTDPETERIARLKQEDHFLRTDGLAYLMAMNNQFLMERTTTEETIDGLRRFDAYLLSKTIKHATPNDLH